MQRDLHMGTEDRLKGILARQAAAAEANQRDEAAAQAAAEKAKLLRVRVSKKWQDQRTHIDKFIDQLNQQMSKNGVHLVVRASRYKTTDATMELDRMEIGYDQYTRDEEKLTFSVRPNGEIDVWIASDKSPAKNSALNAFEATNDDFEGALLDFLDLNTPK